MSEIFLNRYENWIDSQLKYEQDEEYRAYLEEQTEKEIDELKLRSDYGHKFTYLTYQSRISGKTN